MKYAIWPGGTFYAKMLNSARTEPESAVVMLLWRTGMHSSTLIRKLWLTKGEYIEWERPKTHKWLRAKVPASELRVIRACIFAGSLPATQGILRRWTKRIGARAGYAEQRVTPLTFRHSRAVWLLDNNMPIHRVAHALGCSVTTLEKHYAQLEAERLVR